MKVLYAFSDFVHPETNQAISEHAVNELKDGELIEDRFEGDDYRLMIVANKFMTGFDQPLLAGMFLDKPVVDRNAVQTVSRFLTCFFSYPDEVKEFVAFAEYVGPQLIKQGSVSELMKQIRQTQVVKVAVEYQGEVRSGGGVVKLRPGGGKKSVAPPPKKVSVQDMVDEIRTRFDISDEEALYIKQVTELKVADPTIRTTVQAHRDDVIYLEGAYRGQVNGEIQNVYNGLARYEELADPKYKE